MSYYVLADQLEDRRLLNRILTNPIFCKSPQALLAALKKDRRGQIVILNLAIKGYPEAGFQTARLVRLFDPDAQLILLTHDEQLGHFCFEYQLSAIDFILKSNDLRYQERLHRAIKQAYRNLQQIRLLRPLPIHFPNGQHQELVDLAQLIYIASEKGTHHLLLHEANRTRKIRANLKDMAPYHDCLCQIHAAYCINLNYLEEYIPSQQLVLLTNGVQLPVSRRYAKNVRPYGRWTRATDPELE
ncbi:LytTR family transcriptional regulator DNA-binding domain-containing protein [Leuconostocaceae bacterium ESL0958]|nr:LytTR family transcriptional regulator DNA-binding domain-containing protein [Leuconostocaceae bacterium ESL0958]